MSFDAALEFVLGYEGGYSNNPKDPGGATNLGITQKTLDQFNRANRSAGLPTDVRALKREHAARIYRAWYWDPIKGDDLPPAIALVVFDGAVNQGVSRSARILQRSLELVQDGVIGPITISAARNASVAILLREIAARRALAYAATGNLDAFGLGWFRRLMGCTIAATKLVRV